MLRVSGLFRAPISADRPEKYKPSDVHHVVHYHFQKAYSFVEDCVLSNLSIESKYKTYQKADGSKINYFETIQDTPSEFQKYPLLSDWLKKIVDGIQKNVFSKNDIFIAPLVYVKNDRNHFTTFLLAFDDNGKAFAYIIEPRADNYRFHIEYIYPVDALIQDCKAILSGLYTDEKPNVVCKNILAGVQPLTDDINCGPFHINFAEILASVSRETLFDSEKIENILKKTNLHRRNQDSLIIKKLFKKNDKEERRSSEFEDAVLGSTDEDGFEDIAEFADDFTAIDFPRTESNPEVRELRKRTPRACINKCIAELLVLSHQEKSGIASSHALDHKHDDVVPRYNISLDLKKLTVLLELINIMLMDTENDEHKRLKLAVVLCHLYKRSESQMKHHIEGALAKLLDIKIEFQSIAFVNGRVIGLMELFEDKIKFFHLICKLPENQYQDSDDVFVKMTDSEKLKSAMSLIDTYFGVEKNDFDLRFAIALADINAYKAPSSSFLSSFSNHTREASKNLIVNMLESISTKAEHANFKVACFLYNNYLAINQPTSTLRLCITNALVATLNCRSEYQFYKDNNDDDFIKAFFKKKLDILSVCEYGKVLNVDFVKTLDKFHRESAGILNNLTSSQDDLKKSEVIISILSEFNALEPGSPRNTA